LLDIRVENSAEDFIAFTVIFYQRNKPNYRNGLHFKCIMFLVLTKKFHVIIGFCVLRYRMQLNGEENVET